jgi:hypothetical protein
MFGIQGGYLGNTAGMAAVRRMSVPGELTGINPMTESYPQFMGNTTGPLVAGLGAMPPRIASMGGMPGAAGNIGGMMAQLPGGEQGPAQGPNTPVRNYPGMGYGPYGPGGGGMPPMPMRQATGFDRKFVS